jgi:mannose-6-phosphate isomerase-like protein (cupin superfamily)
MLEIVDLSRKFALFSEHWRPKVVGELNGSYIKLVKLKGEFVWHRHEQEDELFLVIKGSLVIKLRDGDLALGQGQFVVIPRGVEHMPVAAGEVHVMLLEPNSTINTGDAPGEPTVDAERI